MSSFLLNLVWGLPRGIIHERSAFAHLVAPAEFARLLNRERARSDRTGEEFSLLVYSPRDDGDATASLACLASILRGRLRLTDDAGWIGDRQIGVLLPMTPGAGAWTVADAVVRSFPTDITPPNCDVFTYPSHWLTDDGPNGKDIGSPLPHSPAEKPVHAMEPLFMKRTPGWKRAIDVTGALLGLVLLSPLLIAIGLAVKLTSRGPVFFRQNRTGQGGRRFTIYKFRSMVADAEASQAALLAMNEQDGPAFKIRKDPRITPLGRLLRKTSLDELPQLWNVLVGHMSLVGPRPLPCSQAAACEQWHHRRLDVAPGLTCIWQVKGRSRVTFAEWIRMDLRYVTARSLALDLKLLVQTVPAVLAGSGR